MTYLENKITINTNLIKNMKWIVLVFIVTFEKIRLEEAIPRIIKTSSLNETMSSVNSNDTTYRRLTDDHHSILINNNFKDHDASSGKGKEFNTVSAFSKKLPSTTICGPLSEEERIIGGENTAIDEFPWLVRIKYLLDNGKEVYACAGSLITDHYVLTAAHCAVNLTIKEVRLGDWNLETEYDCQDSVCSGAAVDIKVSRVTTFPGYNKMDTFKGDLALLRLQRPVNFTDFIRPICLPTTEHIAKQDYSPGSTYWTAGWGKTEFAKKSPIKQKVELESVPIATCQLRQPSLSDIAAPFVICAGGREGKDTCTGDSGGSLVKQVHGTNSTNWFLMGVTSYGYKECGTEGRPGLYARITPYMDWILRNVL